MSDITDDEEALLPMPSDWMKSVDSSGNLLYKNIRTDLVASEHPYITVATNQAINPDTGESGWDHPLVRECLARVLMEKGYSNLAKKIHRQPTATVVSTPFDTPKNIEVEEDDIVDVDEDFNIVSNTPFRLPQGSPAVSSEASKSPAADPDAAAPLDHFIQNHQSFERWHSSTGGIFPRVNDSELPGSNSPENMSDVVEPAEGTAFYSGTSNEDVAQPRAAEPVSPAESTANKTKTSDMFSMQPGELELSRRSSKWHALRAGDASALRDNARGEEQQESMANVPPVVQKMNDLKMNIYGLLLRTRLLFAQNSNMECLTLNVMEVNSYKSGRGRLFKEILEISGHLLGYLRHQPKLLLSSIEQTYKNVSTERAQAQSFVLFNRLLHPFSSDSSMSTACLLEALNYQVEETAHIIHVYPNIDPKLLMSRALFMSEPEITLQWHPTEEPIPADTQNTSLLACILKGYSIRRDVSTFFRAAWKPVLPALVSLLEPEVTPGGNMRSPDDRTINIQNIAGVAFRLLESFMVDETIVLFPAPATAVCRALLELCGLDGVHTYLLYFLILPNLVRLLLGEHDSADCEELFRFNPDVDAVGCYYDYGLWLKPINEYGESPLVSSDGKVIHEPTALIIWSVWRIYSWALLHDAVSLAALTAKEFFAPLGLLDGSVPVSDNKLRNMLSRARTKVENGVSLLTRLPIDSQGCHFLEIDPSKDILDIPEHFKTLRHSLSKRLSSLLMKPAMLTSHLVMADYEIHFMLEDVASYIETSNAAEMEPLMELMERYEFCSTKAELDKTETIMVVRVSDEEDSDWMIDENTIRVQNMQDPAHPRISNETYIDIELDPAEENLVHGISAGDDSKYSLQYRRDEEYINMKLQRGFKLASKYFDALSRLHHRLEYARPCTLHELVEDDSWFYSPEYEIDMKSSADYKHYMKKPTKSWASKVKPSLHGLVGMLERQQAAIRASERQCVSDHHFNKKFMSMLRGGDDNESNRKKVSNRRGNLNHTTVEVDPQSTLLVPTIATLSRKLPSRPTAKDIFDQYVNSLRSHPASKTMPRSNRAAKLSAKPTFLGHSGIQRGPASSGPSIESAAIPFPEHLRHRIRSNHGELFYSQGIDDSAAERTVRSMASGHSNSYNNRSEPPPRYCSPTKSTQRAQEELEYYMEEHRPADPPPPPFTTGVDKGHFYRFEFLPSKKNPSPPPSPVSSPKLRPAAHISNNLSVDTRDFPSMSSSGYQHLPAQSPKSLSENRSAWSPSRARSTAPKPLIPEGKNPRFIRGTAEPTQPPPTPSSGTFHSPEVDPLLGRSESAGAEGDSGAPPPADVDSEESKADSEVVQEEFVTTPKNGQVPLIPSMKSFSRSELLESLVSGLRAVKHGRKGWPKEREIYLDAERGELRWREPQGPNGSSFWKSLRSSSSGNDSSCLPLDAITELRRGVQTEILQRAGLLDPACCLSICTANRSLDLTFRNTHDRNFFLRCIEAALSPRDISIY